MWKTVIYSKKQIDKAGQMIKRKELTPDERKQYLDIIDNWRAAHAFPMNTFTINLKKKTSNNMGIIVVQRLKRLNTIIEKLDRFSDMKLSRMQDLGGCRVILPKIEDVYSLRDKIVNSRIRHKLHNEKDYIKEPNPDTGYRGIHLIYQYVSDRNDKYNGLCVEIQLRTKLQHLWATTVETVGMFTHNELKFNKGEKDWLRFFQCVSETFAFSEDNRLNNIESAKQYEKVEAEIYDLMDKLDVINKLYGFAAASIIYNNFDKKEKKYNNSGYFLIELNLSKNHVNVTSYKNSEKSINKAIEDYMQIEAKKDSDINAVLVSAKSMDTLKKAYPNYFVNVRQFCDTLIKIMKKNNIKARKLLG